MLNQTQLKTQAQQFIENNWEDIIHDIREIVAIPSVVDFSNATPAHPSGDAAYEGLNCAINIAKRLGLDATNEHGEVGYADLPGIDTSEEYMLALMCHADVVAPGSGWTGDPWILTRKDGFILGRGVLDDKGPLVISLWALHFFKQLEYTLPYTIRMIIGTNEETGDMRDAKYYLAHHAAPAFMFTPDNAFPICYGEKGMFHAHMTSNNLYNCNARIMDFSTFDTPINAVPGRARVIIKTNEHALPSSEHIHIEYTHIDHEPCAILEAIGKGGHASLPEGTVNAVGILVSYLLEHELVSAEERDFLSLMSRALQDSAGSELGVAASDEHFGNLTCVLSTVAFKNNALTCGIDIRFPASISAQTIREVFESHLEPLHGSFTYDAKEPFLMDPNNEIIQSLSHAYTVATGKDGAPFTIGGGTYAREFPRAVSFGVEDMTLKAPEWVGPMHGADEGVAESTLKEALLTYIIAIDDLMQKDFPALAQKMDIASTK